MSIEIRDVLFGDLPLATWASLGPGAEPWQSFAAAQQAVEAGQPERAVDILHRIAETEGLESRHYAQAWHALRGLEQPAEAGKQLFGVVIEVAMGEGQDIVVAYADRSARCYHHSGSAIVWERPDDSLDANIDALLDAGRDLMGRIGPWDAERPGPPRPGFARINLVTSTGLHFGEGPLNVLTQDPMGEPLLTAALNLMEGLFGKTSSGKSTVPAS
jgi:hypothetical protein